MIVDSTKISELVPRIRMRDGVSPGERYGNAIANRMRGTVRVLGIRLCSVSCFAPLEAA